MSSGRPPLASILLAVSLASFFIAGVTVYENWPTEQIYNELPSEVSGRKSAHDFIWHNAVPLKYVSGTRLTGIPGLPPPKD